MISRALAVVVIVVFALVLGVALLYGVRARQEPAPVASVPTATATATALATPFASSVAQPPVTWASACGTVSDFLGNSTSADGSLVLNSPGRSPLKITLTSAHSTPGGRFGGYICTGLGAGSPYPIFGGLWPPNTAGFVAEGTVPATRAEPAPGSFVVPQSCAYVAPPLVGAGQTEWRVDCGATANRDARGTLAPALTQQGWTLCGAVTATATWAKGTSEIGIAESSGSPGDYPKVTQRARTNSCP